MDGSMFDGLFTAIVVIGVIIGIALCGLVWALSHLSISIAWV